MKTVKILTDSCAGLSPAEIEALDVTVLPLQVQIGDQILEDGSKETTEAFFTHQLRGLHPWRCTLPV